MKHRDTREQIVLPIFYRVNPSYVRRNIPVFGEAGNIKGWHITGENCDRSETEYIKDVAKDVIEKLKSKTRMVSEGRFGIHFQKEEILRLIEKEENRVIGLWGPGGIGKTTLAEAVFNQLSDKFEKNCFLQNVREKIEKEGTESLKNKFLSDLFKSDIGVQTPTVGCSVTKNMLKNSTVLVVLDDVSSFQHVDGMDIKYFGDGSKIIITSRERQVLARADEIHEVEGLSDNHSVQLFSAFAFKQSELVAAEFQTVSSEFLRYAQGSPLALKVLGSMLYNKPIKVWKSEAAKLGEYSKPEILQVLERSYRGLDELEKKIFLDIAIFFKGEQHPNEYVEAFLGSCYGGGYLCGISSLIDKCFLEIRTFDPYYEEEPYQYFDMHDMLEEMGKHIETENYPGNCRRLWKREDVTGLLKYNQGANSIEGITCKYVLSQLSLTGLPKMPKLRFIYILSLISVDQEIAVDIEVLPDDLRYLEWLRYPFESLSSTFNPVNLVVVKLGCGKMKRLWNGDQVPLNLRELDVRWCTKLEEIPNLSGATKLKILNCSFCRTLVKLAGLENLASLEKLYFYNCLNLVKIPSLSGATKLKILDCRYCSSLVELPSLNHLTSLEELNFNGCWKLVKIPSLSGATKLKILNCHGCMSLVELPSLNHLTSLEKLDLDFCESLKKYPELPNNLSELYLSHSGIEEVSASNGLKRLKMSFSNHLEILPQLPPNLVQLDAIDCKSLTEVSFTVEDPNLTQMDLLRDRNEIFYDFSDCYSLKPESVNNIEEYAIHKIKYLAMGRISGLYRDSKQLLCCLPKKEISANKFEFQSESSSLTFEIDKNMCNPSGNLAFAICLVVDVPWLRLCGADGVVCEYRLTALTAAGRDECGCHTYHLDNISGRDYKGDHMLILFSDKLIFKGEYKEASFTFHFDTEDLDTEEVHEDSATEEDLDTEVNLELELGSSSKKVKKCGVHVFPVDLRGFQCSDEMRRLEYQDARSEKIHEDSATEEDSSIVMRPSPKRRISDDGEEGVEEGPEILK